MENIKNNEEEKIEMKINFKRFKVNETEFN
jgi:hypothetical protein